MRTFQTDLDPNVSISICKVGPHITLVNGVNLTRMRIGKYSKLFEL